MNLRTSIFPAIVPRWIVALVVSCITVSAQEVFREFTFNHGASPGKRFVEHDPGARRASVAAIPRRVPRLLQLDLLLVEFAP